MVVYIHNIFSQEKRQSKPLDYCPIANTRYLYSAITWEYFALYQHECFVIPSVYKVENSNYNWWTCIFKFVNDKIGDIPALEVRL